MTGDTTVERSEAAPAEEIDAERALAAQPKCKVLVIDDDECIRTALAEILEMCGYSVAVAADGVEGIELLEVGLDPNAIVLDLMMPRMDGWEFLQRVRSDPKFQDVVVVVASAVAADAPAGADVCLQKPFDVARLDREVAQRCAH